MSKKTVIFDLDGTLADITSRRELSIKDNGKMDWDTFFNPKFISLDDPNTSVIKMAQMLHSQGFKIVIFSGRSKATKDATKDWLKKHDVPFDLLKMRPTGKDWHFMKDSLLKSIWLKELFDNPTEEIFAVFDDRNQVVEMWRDNGLTVFQVAEGDF
jgi:FMN phosphatase YigB (HAD superfamily)